jgi:hypothetical protein
MNRLQKIAALTLLACLLFLLAAWAARVIYLRHTATQERIVALESKVGDLRLAHPTWRVRYSGRRISTTDRPESTNGFDYRLIYGTNAVQKFDDGIGKESGKIVTAWISDWTPRSELTKFEQLSVRKSQGPGAGFEVSAKAHTNESIAMEFEVIFIIEE